MKSYGSDQIRNIVLLGHGGSGKTTVAEAMAHVVNLTKRQGKVEEGNTISDFDQEEIKRQFSINTSIVPIEWGNDKINVLDTPGYFDFVGEVKEAVRVADGAVIVVSGKSGVEVGTEKAWEYAKEENMPIMIFVNGMDDDSASLVKTLEQLKVKFGKSIAPFEVPIKEDGHFIGFVNVVRMKAKHFVTDHVEGCPIPNNMEQEIKPVREMILEAVAETSEQLMDKFFNEEPFTQEEIEQALHKGIVEGSIVPVLCGSALNNTGIEVLMNAIDKYLPSTKELKPHMTAQTPEGENIDVVCNDEDTVSAFVFKTVVDPFIGRLSIFKVYSGTLTVNTPVFNANNGQHERISHLYVLRGKEQIEVNALKAGDIGAVAKLNHTDTGHTLCDKSRLVKLPPIHFPESFMCKAVEPKGKGDEDKISSGLHKLMEEDLTMKVRMDNEMHQELLYGVGEQHLDVIVSKLKSKFKVDVNLKEPKVSYRETIKSKVLIQGKHKKQSGGHGQYGDVKIEFEPSGDLVESYIFEEKIFGGAVPRNYFPAVEKGLQESVLHGVLAGYPVVGVKATLVDGSYHPVDSSEMAFKLATIKAFKDGIIKASPVILEPIVTVKVVVPDEYLGDIMGDFNKRRGRVLGMNPKNGKQELVAEVPVSSMFSYATDLRSITHGRGEFTMNFERYEEAPFDVQEKVIKEKRLEI